MFHIIPPAYAYDTTKPGCMVASPLGANTYDVPTLACLGQVVSNFIYLLLAFVGFVALVIFLSGAIKFVISRGDPKAIQSAQKTMTYAIIGLVIIIFSYTIINLITDTLGLPNLFTNFTIYQQ